MTINEATEQAYKKGYEDGFKEGYDGGFDVGKRHAMDWIPVTERLPEYGQRVLAYSGKVFKPSVFWYIFYSEDYAMWKNEVTHWMPLPEPPKGE